jgi:hypothetical protein
MVAARKDLGRSRRPFVASYIPVLLRYQKTSVEISLDSADTECPRYVSPGCLLGCGLFHLSELSLDFLFGRIRHNLSHRVF